MNVGGADTGEFAVVRSKNQIVREIETGQRSNEVQRIIAHDAHHRQIAHCFFRKYCADGRRGFQQKPVRRDSHLNGRVHTRDLQREIQSQLCGIAKADTCESLCLKAREFGGDVVETGQKARKVICAGFVRDCR